MTNWLIRIAWKDDPSEIYRSKDYPYVFLGSSDLSDMESVARVAGQPICARIDVTDDDVYRLNKTIQTDPQNRIPDATLKVPFPDNISRWKDNQQLIEQVREGFGLTAERVADIIASNNSGCPIYVHCTAGMNRSVSVLAAALARLTGRSIDELVAEISDTRAIKPDPLYLEFAREFANQRDAVVPSGNPGELVGGISWTSRIVAHRGISVEKP